MQKESKNIGKTTTYTHFRISVFRFSIPIPDCLLFDFSFIVFQICDLRFPISIFRFLVHSEFMFQFFICRSVYFRFQKFDFRFPVFGLRRFDTSQIVFHFVSSRFSDFTFIVSDIRYPIFEFPMSTAKRKKRCPPPQKNKRNQLKRTQNLRDLF